MSVYKRKDSPYWWVKITQKGQRTVYESTETKDREKAQEYHDKLKASLWDQAKLGAKPKYTWEEAVVKWLGETKHKATQHDDLTHLRWLDVFMREKQLDQINREDIDRIISARSAGGSSNGTVNRTLAVVRAILRRATHDWEWIERHPKIRMLPEPKRRVRWLTQEEAARLIAELPDHLVPIVRFSLETGLRKSNVTDLQWSQVDIDRACAWIHPDQAKARKAIAIPLSPTAISVLQAQIGKHIDYVFTYQNKRVSNVNTRAWRNALKRAGIENFRWHDLRHTWASWHIQNKNTPLHVLQELGGWDSPEMVQRYAHLSSDHLTQYAGNMGDKLH